MPRSNRKERELAEDLIFNRRPDALQRYIEYFEKVAPQAAERSAAGPDPDLTPEQRLHWCILHRHKDGIEADIDTVVNRGDFPTRHEAAVNALNTVLLPAMKEVGDKFGAGELILPFVLQSAEVMKKAVSHLENYLEKKEGVSKGIVVHRHGVRRRPRHRQEPGQDHPLEQRLRGRRPGQAGAGGDDHHQGRRGQGHCHRPFGAACFHLQADAAYRQ